MVHITLRLYEDGVLCVQLHVLLLCSERCHAASLASVIKQDSQSHRGFTRCSLSASLPKNFKPSFLCPFLYPVSLFSLPRVPLVLPMQQTKAHTPTPTHTHTHNFSAVRVMITSCQIEREREREGSRIEALQAVQRCTNACVYLLLAGKGCHDEDRTKHTWTTYGDTVTKETQ